jgi:Ca2+-binding EF-hand superfamily protein
MEKVSLLVSASLLRIYPIITSRASFQKVNELEYIRFMLVAMKKVDAKLFDDLHQQFLKLDATGDGKITKNDLKIVVVRKMKRVHNKLSLSEYKVRLH